MIEFIGFMGQGDERAEFVLRIRGPFSTEGEGDYFVELEAPSLLARTERIYGIDPDQARELAARYLEAHLDNRELYDRDGHLVGVRSLVEQI